MKLFAIAGDTLREASSRKWIVVFCGGVTLVLSVIGFALKMDVVDGALAASRLFGRDVNSTIRAADLALRPIFLAAAYFTFYGGSIFGILACADFGPTLLSPGRIEHLLALPVRRWELYGGTLLGVLALSTFAAVFGSGGLVLILGVKTGVWTMGPIWAGLLAAWTFTSIYAVMLTSALFARSAAISAAVGGFFFIFGIIAGNRSLVAELFESEVAQRAFLFATAPVPRISALADTAARMASTGEVDFRYLAALVAGTILFTLGASTVGIWRFVQKDF